MGLDSTVTLTRVDAASRELGETAFVAPVGWSTDVYDLTGAATIVWRALSDPATIVELARRCDVDPHDELLTGAVTALIDRGLVDVDAR